MRRNKN